MDKKKIFSTVFFFILFFIVSVGKTQAFLAASSFAIITTSLLPQVFGVVFGFLLSAWVFLKKYKKVSAILFVLSLSLLGYFAVNFYRLKSINSNFTFATGSKASGEEDIWESFRKAVLTGAGNKSHNALDYRKDYQPKEILDLRVLEYKPEKYTKKVGYTDSELFKLDDADYDLPGDLFIQVIYNAFDEEALTSFLNEKGISKSDKVLFYCPSGATSSVAAFILNHHGYDAEYLPLAEMKTNDYKELVGSDRLEQALFYVDFFGAAAGKKKLFFLLTPNNLYTWRDTFCFQKPLPEDIFILRTKGANIPKFDMNCLDGIAKNVDLSRIDIPYFEDRMNQVDLDQYAVICYDNWHCFLTKHYLVSLNLQDQFSTIYCMICSSFDKVDYEFE